MRVNINVQVNLLWETANLKNTK